jgi:hypothetical protein
MLAARLLWVVRLMLIVLPLGWVECKTSGLLLW